MDPIDLSDKLMKDTAMVIAMSVRNAMEDFHCANLTDEQMKELNPIVRNAVYTALYAWAHRDSEQWCDKYLTFQMRCIPDYWEEPELLESAKKLRSQQKHD